MGSKPGGDNGVDLHLVIAVTNPASDGVRAKPVLKEAARMIDG
jgi:hypothetical protein